MGLRQHLHLYKKSLWPKNFLGRKKGHVLYPTLYKLVRVAC